MSETTTGSTCPLPEAPYLSGITQVRLDRDSRLANAAAARRLGDHILPSWCDRDRDLESPQRASECHEASATSGYVDYGLHHGATLILDIEDGRFVFFYLPVDLMRCGRLGTGFPDRIP